MYKEKMIALLQEIESVLCVCLDEEKLASLRWDRLCLISDLAKLEVMEKLNEIEQERNDLLREQVNLNLDRETSELEFRNKLLSLPDTKE